MPAMHLYGGGDEIRRLQMLSYKPVGSMVETRENA
jgi:hypothetical protein